MHEAAYALKTAASARSFKPWQEMRSSGNRTKSVQPGKKYRSIRHTKISEIHIAVFGRMERAQYFSAKQNLCPLTKFRIFCVEKPLGSPIEGARFFSLKIFQPSNKQH